MVNSLTNPRTGITAPDTLIDLLFRNSCGPGSGVVRLGATCTVAGATLTCRVAFFDAVGTYTGLTTSITFTSATTSLLEGGAFTASPNVDAWFHAGGATSFAVHVDTVSAGIWTILPIAG